MKCRVELLEDLDGPEILHCLGTSPPEYTFSSKLI
jgi:hypothetical protein